MKYILAAFFISVSVFAQEFNKLDENGKKQGIWKGIYEDSKRPRYEGTFDHGKERGTFKFFDNTKVGTVIATREFSSKENSCYTIFYNQNKNKVSEGKVVNKQFDGQWKYYHEDLPNIMTSEYYKNGKLEGVRKVFYQSGKIAEETSYKNGIKQGKYKSYAENGFALEESNYKNGEYDGLAIFKDPNNQIVGQGIFKNGKKVGMWKVLEKGKLKEVNMNYINKNFKRPVMPKDPAMEPDKKVDIK
ncbi:hypothetical protein [Flavobacterium sp.]|uniref:toxin-antitoxin system YwqK family antitoxin n=1 Tax=Flavobacterium sp. TaxID=239 RepID=UPI0025E5E37B|nr:hypothetical protein [Flavobacterium sp.]